MVYNESNLALGLGCVDPSETESLVQPGTLKYLGSKRVCTILFQTPLGKGLVFWQIQNLLNAVHVNKLQLQLCDSVNPNPCNPY